MTETTARKLLASLLDALASEHVRPEKEGAEFTAVLCEALEQARAYLAQPEPAGPTDEELYDMWDQEGNEADFQDCRRFARAVLARWGNHPHPRPIPVAERLPTEADFDTKGRCWWAWGPTDLEWNEEQCPGWMLLPPDDDAPTDFVAWLPAAAIPLPE